MIEAIFMICFGSHAFVFGKYENKPMEVDEK